MTKGYSVRAVALATLAGSGLLLAGCHSKKPPANGLDAIDNQLVDGAVIGDNAATRALASEIRVDPHAKAVRGAVAPSRGGGTPSLCLDGLAYANDWADRLPADLPMPAQARLTEAAGHDGACKARVVSFTVPGDRAALIAWYATRAKAAGYSAARDDKNGDWNLTGSKGGALYYIMAGPSGAGGTPVDYVWTQGG